ncbi:MAG TPA: hypothetical protein VHP83_00995 [Aggregatilineaceae bacterium]|nr:hypothetical protein [Aggregatilineaceae bacterium]
MNPQDYQAFTAALQRNLERDPRVIGLMAAGSMAQGSHQPDQWSDHDFWVVVESPEWFHNHLDWLPDRDQIVLHFREQHGGFKTLYRSGHLLEYAVSGRANLLTAKVNDYRLLIDRANLAADLARMQGATTSEFFDWIRDDHCLFGQFITTLLVGVGRFHRGEWLSARQLITVLSLGPLFRLIPKYISTDHPQVIDNLDPLRRFELAYPDLSAEINCLLRLDLDQAAAGLLDLAEHLLRHRLPDYPVEAVALIRGTV